MKQDIYRKAALERIASVDQLDKVLKITSPLSWLALLGITLMIVLVVIWAFTGTLPSTITANGVVVSATAATNSYLARIDGTVQLLVREGDAANRGYPIAIITQNGISTTFESDQTGIVANILVENGATVAQGTELFRVRPWLPKNQKQVVVCYVPISDVNKIELDMPANITLASKDSSTYGHMEGRVINIDSWATSTKGLESVLGSDNNMAALFIKDTSVCAVTLELYIPTDPGKSINGYWWSNAKGYQVSITDREMCSVKITTKTEKPITKLFVKLKEIWGE